MYPFTAIPSIEHDEGRGVANAVGVALGLAALIIVAEYAARRLLAPTAPIVGAPLVNDMVATTLAYTVLVTIVTPPGQQSMAALLVALRQILGATRSWLSWAGGVGFLGAVLLLVPLDSLLWGNVRLPGITVPPSETVLLAEWAMPLSIVALFLVNGLVIPIAEERLWRGLIQPHLFSAWGLVPALVVTALLFSLKHAIVDASLGRMLALVAGGLVLGYVAHRAGGGDGGRRGWKVTAVSHILANIAGTSIALASGALGTI